MKKKQRGLSRWNNETYWREWSSVQKNNIVADVQFLRAKNKIGKRDEEVYCEIAKAINRGPDDGYYYRGLSDVRYGFVTSLYRSIPNRESINYNVLADSEFEHESKLLRNALPYLEDAGLSFVEILSLLQHSGYPTRLLDVTANFNVALWFATADQDHDGVLFRIKAEAKSVPPQSLTCSYTTKKTIEYYISKWKEHVANIPYWSLLTLKSPQAFSKRIHNQEGHFIYGPLPKPTAKNYRFYLPEKRNATNATWMSVANLTSLLIRPKNVTKTPTKTPTKMPNERTNLEVFIIPHQYKLMCRNHLKALAQPIDSKFLFPDSFGAVDSLAGRYQL